MSISDKLLETDDEKTLDISLYDTDEEKEKKKFTDHSALVTFLLLCIGPLAILASAGVDAVDQIIVSKGLKNIQPDVTTIIGFASMPLTVLTAFGNIFGQALTVYLSKLLGEGSRTAAAYLANDAIRIAILASIPFAIIYNFLIKPFLRFCNCPSQYVQDAYNYLLPLVILNPFVTVITVEVNFLQSIGRSGLSGLFKIAACCLATLVFTPILVFAFKATSKYLKLATGLSEVIISILLFILIYSGKFSLKLNFRMLIEKPHKEILKALVLSLPIVLQLLNIILPPSIVIKSLAKVDAEHSDLVGSAFSSFNRVNSILLALVGLFTAGFMSAATHAFGSKNYKRMFQLLGWALLFSFVCVTIVSAIVVFGPGVINGMFLNTKEEIDYANRMLPVPFYTYLLNGLSMPLGVFLIVIGKPVFSIIGIALQMILICVGADLLARFQNDAIVVMHAYNISNVVMFLVFASSFLFYFCRMKKNNQVLTDESQNI
ncbi:MatE family protein [Histomonas meleagridis]|uniref:MatE family protein n=1 Tax=Histomonas meleagridis TaxID=135588 RepID=UPI00355AC8B9|nr:MatE family protein [Histomonas meleagridis]KAH0800491.1 MatE family protein [Histomonas meleagridis]